MLRQLTLAVAVFATPVASFAQADALSVPVAGRADQAQWDGGSHHHHLSDAQGSEN